MSTPMRFVLLSHTAAKDVFRVGSHHYARELALAGHNVLRVAPPSNPWRRILKERSSGNRTAPHVWTDAYGVRHLEFETPFPLSRGPASVQDRVGRHGAYTVAQAMPWAGAPTAYIVDEPHFVHLFPHLPRATVVYRPTDIQSHTRTRAAEAKMAPWADRVVVTSRYLLEALPAGFSGLPSMVLPNGVDFDRFNNAFARGPREPAVVYVGSLDDRFSATTTQAMAACNAQTPFDIYGPNPPISLSDPSNLTYHGPVDYEDVPEVLAKATVGVLPLSDAFDNASRSPMKLYEYLSAGLNVVCRRIPSLGEVELPGVHFYDHASQAPGLVQMALAQSLNIEGHSASADQSWRIKAETLAKFAGGEVT